MIERIKKAWAKLPIPAKAELRHDVEVFVATAIATAKPLLPALLATPSMGLTKAIVLAVVVTAAKATIPLLRAGGRRGLNAWLTGRIPQG